MVYATGGKLRGGNSGFAFTGNFIRRGEEIHVKISTLRHNPDPGFKPLFGTDMITLALKGTEHGDMSTSKAARCNCPASPSRRS